MPCFRGGWVSASCCIWRTGRDLARHVLWSPGKGAMLMNISTPLNGNLVDGSCVEKVSDHTPMVPTNRQRNFVGRAHRSARKTTVSPNR